MAVVWTDVRTRAQIDREIAEQVEAERARLRMRLAARPPVKHFRRPVERPFTAAEREHVTILFGGLTAKHEALIKSVFQAGGYRTEILPTADVAAFQLGKEYGNNGQCNPTYFTVGQLIKYLQHLESIGLSRQEIIDGYVFFTAGSCGPCRFGMYEGEYRLALQNAGFDGFRVLLFQQTDGIRAASGEPGLKFTVDFGMGAFIALNLGDVLNDLTYQLRPFEVQTGHTDGVMQEVMDTLTRALRERPAYEIEDRAPGWMVTRLRGRKRLRNTLNTLAKIHDHLYGRPTTEALAAARERIGTIEVDRLRIKPIVKVTGEFWAQTTEGDGNFQMFRFLEREGAEVMVEPISTWVMYMLWLAKANRIRRKDVDYPAVPWTDPKGRLMRALRFRSRVAYLASGTWFWNHQYRRLIRHLGGLAHPLESLDELARLAAPYYNVFARGGEGHMEVAKNIYYTVKKRAHMVLSLKPFGCMPSSQSDGVQAAVMNHFKDTATGYAKDILRDVLHADAALVETVAHTESALRFYTDPHVIVDVGGQDIKLIVLKHGRVKDFKLNTQCSAGNGYFLQSTAEGFGIDVADFADRAFRAEVMPVFGYGCAVFMQSDIVNFQRQGWTAEEILAGLAAVLPKNIFLYVANVPNLATLGSRVVLQGGTQHNLAAVKAQVDFIRSNFRGTDVEPDIIVHEHCGEAGAIGAAVEAMRLYRRGRRTTFVGLDAVRTISYRTTRSEATRCSFCKNSCLRTFVDIRMPAGAQPVEGAHPFASTVPKADDERRLIIATCEKGTVEDVETMRGIKSGIDEAKRANPNLVDIAAKEAFRQRGTPSVGDPVPDRVWTSAARERAAAMRRRGALRIGIPRVLNMYTYAPFFNAYFESLGVLGGNIVYSDYTSAELYREGARRGAIDPCFPAKVSIAHVHNLLFVKHARKKLDYIFFPMVDVLHTALTYLQASNACPTVTVTPETAKAAFTNEGDAFAQHGVTYLCPMLNFGDRPLLCQQLFDTWAPMLGLSRNENRRAIDAGFDDLLAYETDMRRRARVVLDQLEREGRVGLVVLARPYHHDPGLNHAILEEFQKLGYPVFSQSTLPMDPDLLERLFGDEVREGAIRDPLEIQDVWKNSYSENTNQKVWAAKFTARHPNLVALELSSFKCGHDAPIYSVIESIIEQSGTPYFSFKDIDENKPTGSIKIRVETIHYFLKRYAEDLQAQPVSEADIERRIEAYERTLREQLLSAP